MRSVVGSGLTPGTAQIHFNTFAAVFPVRLDEINVNKVSLL